mmetsp:Transcript_54489/g.130164  ORF Transcript_54489/g.130164 Transcript_54489/m.130164 type:complete len:277 (-) Transcript_54489:89-919(-)
MDPHSCEAPPSACDTSPASRSSSSGESFFEARAEDPAEDAADSELKRILSPPSQVDTVSKDSEALRERPSSGESADILLILFFFFARRVFRPDRASTWSSDSPSWASTLSLARTESCAASGTVSGTGSLGSGPRTEASWPVAAQRFADVVVSFTANSFRSSPCPTSSSWGPASSWTAVAVSAGMSCAASGFHFFMYQLSSFWVLSCVPPITHSVLNTLKRVVIIVVSIIVFRTPVTVQSAAGTAVAIGGVLLYSLTKAHYSKKTSEEKSKEVKPQA